MITRFAKAIWRVLSLNCEESAQLMSRTLDQSVSWHERLAYRLHAFTCRSCRHFERQIHFMREAARRLGTRGADKANDISSATHVLPEQSRIRIAAVLREADGRRDRG